jgi:transglutaminase-like putative cysteine protease
MAIKKRVLDLAGSAVLSTMLSGALTLILCGALGLSVSAVWVYALSGALALFAAGCAWSAKGAAASAALFAALVGAAALLSGFRPLGRLIELIGALSAMGAGEPAMLTEHADTIAAIIGLILTLSVFWMGRAQGGFYPVLTMSLMIMLYGWFLERHLRTSSLLAALAALGAMFARANTPRISYTRTLPAALIIAALALAAAPVGNPTWPPLEQAAQRVRQMFFDYFMFTDARASYSLYTDGYQPMGDALGGPAEPVDRNVMLVESDQALLMRGSVRRTYTSYSWTNSAINNRYLFIDPTKRDVRDRIFDAARPVGPEASAAFRQVTAKVTMLEDGISTLFMPHRVTDVSAALDLAVYYNNNGETFITRRVKSGDTYSFTALVPTDDQALERALTAAMDNPDDQYQAARRDCLDLPGGIERGVYDLAARITEGADTPYRKARAIERYLMDSFEYALDVEYPPSNRDFVSYFLLESKEGYCSYFASAMAVMARMVGLPSRYVEGYMVEAGGADGTVVTGENAHAWVEIYFQGAGWVSFNPTPGSGAAQRSPDGGQPEGAEEDAEPEPTKQPGDTPEPSEAPTQAPHTPEPEASPEPTPEPEDDQDSAAGSQQDEPEPTPEPEDEPPPEDETQDSASRNFGWILWVLLILLIAAASAWVVLRLQKTDPARAQAQMRSASDRLALWYRAMLSALEEQGQSPSPGETPQQFARRLKEAGVAGDGFEYVTRQIALAGYAGRKPDSAVFKQAEAAYRQIVGQLKPVERARFALRRLVRGLGDVRQIP